MPKSHASVCENWLKAPQGVVLFSYKCVIEFKLLKTLPIQKEHTERACKQYQFENGNDNDYNNAKIVYIRWVGACPSAVLYPTPARSSTGSKLGPSTPSTINYRTSVVNTPSLYAPLKNKLTNCKNLINLRQCLKNQQK